MEIVSTVGAILFIFHATLQSKLVCVFHSYRDFVFFGLGSNFVECIIFMLCDIWGGCWLHYWKSRAPSPTFPSLHLHHSSFSNPSVALPTSQSILQPFCCFTYVTTHSPTLLSLLLRHRLFTWRAAHGLLHYANNGIVSTLLPYSTISSANVNRRYCSILTLPMKTGLYSNGFFIFVVE